MTAPPNFLFFMSDQQRADWLGCYGHPVLRTPNIDAIAARGTRFTDFHVATPVCMPNRASLMTGRMPTVHGLRYNGCHLPARANTFVDVLAAVGYDTATIGKSHLQPFTDEPARHLPEPGDGRRRPLEEAWKPDPEDRGHEGPERYTDGERYEFGKPYYGFGHVDMLTRHGDRCGGHYQQWLRSRRKDWRELWDDANELPHGFSCPQAYRTPVPENLYPTAWVADRAIDYLTDEARKSAPFSSSSPFPIRIIRSIRREGIGTCIHPTGSS